MSWNKTAEKINARLLKQTISKSTSDRMKGYLFNVCDIGTGKTASNEDANEVCKWIRDELKSLYGEKLYIQVECFKR